MDIWLPILSKVTCKFNEIHRQDLSNFIHSGKCLIELPPYEFRDIERYMKIENPIGRIKDIDFENSRILIDLFEPIKDRYSSYATYRIVTDIDTTLVDELQHVMFIGFDLKSIK